MLLTEIGKDLGAMLVERQLVKGEDGRDESQDVCDWRARSLLRAVENRLHDGSCDSFDAAHFGGLMKTTVRGKWRGVSENTTSRGREKGAACFVDGPTLGW